MGGVLKRLLFLTMALRSFSEEVSTCTSTNQALTQTLSPCPPALEGLVSDSDWNLTVLDVTGLRQRVVGFGAAWTDTTVEVFGSLDAQSQETLLAELFGSEGTGIKMQLSRHTAGQSDLTPADIGAWSFDEVENDTVLANFSLTDAGERMVDWLKRMTEVGDNVTLLGSVWSPPR